MVICLTGQKKTFKIIRKIDYSERKDIKEEFDKALDLQEAKIAVINEKYDKALHLLEGEEEFLKNNSHILSGKSRRLQR